MVVATSSRAEAPDYKRHHHGTAAALHTLDWINDSFGPGDHKGAMIPADGGENYDVMMDGLEDPPRPAFCFSIQSAMATEAEWGARADALFYNPEANHTPADEMLNLVDWVIQGAEWAHARGLGYGVGPTRDRLSGMAAEIAPHCDYITIQGQRPVEPNAPSRPRPGILPHRFVFA